jgi:hypothetical protein
MCDRTGKIWRQCCRNIHLIDKVLLWALMANWSFNADKKKLA